MDSLESPLPFYVPRVLKQYKIAKENAAMICVPDQVSILAYTNWRARGNGINSKFTFDSLYQKLVESDIDEFKEIHGWGDLEDLLIVWTANPNYSHNMDVVTSIWETSHQERLKPKHIRVAAYEKQLAEIENVYQTKMALYWAATINTEPGQAGQHLKRSDCYLSLLGRSIRDVLLALPHENN